MKTEKNQHLYFILLLAGICLSYLGFNIAYNHYAMLSVDEFWFAHRIYQYKDGIPYRDFAPYKTVLGYYLLLPAMMYSKGILQTLFFTKDFIAVLNMTMLFIASLWLTRFFSRIGVLISLLMMLSSEIFITYSTHLRVDLLGYWLCLFALLWLLENRFILAGIFFGLGFAITQKVIWYIAAANGAIIIHWLFNQHQRKNILNLVIFNISIVSIIASYILFWSWMVNWNTVVASVFGEASAMYQLDWYDNTRKLFWEIILQYNPLIFMLWPLTLLSVFVTYDEDKSYQSRLIIVSTAFIILLCLIPYKQVFPYYMQVTIPILFLLYTSFVTWLIGIFSPNCVPRSLLNINLLWIFISCYLLTIVSLVAYLSLPYSYLFFCFIAILLAAYIIYDPHVPHKIATLSFGLIVMTAISAGILYPYSLLPAKFRATDGAYQQANILAINQLLQNDEGYVAGIELIYNKTQPIAGLRHLMGPAISYLYSPSEKLKSVMLASLYEDPNATVDSVLAALNESSVKFYVNNYRMHALPKKIMSYLDSEYTHWWGSIYLYAPSVAQGKQTIKLKFSGNYYIDSRSSNQITINGVHYVPRTIVALQKGDIVSSASRHYRLKLMLDMYQFSLNAKFERDDWNEMMY